MPYGIVLIKEIPEHWKIIAEVLNEYSLQENGIEMFKETNTALLSWYRCFGWADFVATVWSPNIECIKNWVLKFRDDISSKVMADKGREPKVPITTTIIGVPESELKSRQNELEQFKKLINEYSDDAEKLIKEFNVIRLREFLEDLKKGLEDVLIRLK